MGDVYLAHDELLDRLVAIKFIGRAMPTPAVCARVRREARAAARVQHPNVVSIHRIGDLDGSPYIVTEFVRGVPLDRLEKPMPWQRVLEIGIQLARGLAAAHHQGVLHRDIKPSNAIAGEDGQVKLLDFGLAELVDHQWRSVDRAPRGSGPIRQPRVREIPALAVADTAQMDISDIDTMAALDAVPLAKNLNLGRTLTENLAPLARSPGTTPVWGTPRYMAPEIWRGGAATRGSDVYALGVLLYELCVGATPFADTVIPELPYVVTRNAAPLLEDVRPDVHPRLASVVNQCLRSDPRERFTSAEELRNALEQVEQPLPPAEIPEGNPYRGLHAFEAEHRALFFGRRSEVGSVVERLRSDPFVLVTGDSGVGKSSLCRAGVLPLIRAGALDAEADWQVAHMVSGRHPLEALARACAGALDMPAETLEQAIASGATELGGVLRRRLGEQRRALVLFIDQFEELCTVADPDEAEAVCEALVCLVERSHNLRLLATVRSDFLVACAGLPGIGEALTRALHVLRPMSPDKVREAVVGPARVKGVAFESEILVDELVVSATSAQGGLPLLQFALAELWDARTTDTGPITGRALAAIGGVAGALARHADRVLNGLPREEQRAARRMLMSLVTPARTRSQRTYDELTGDEETADHALEALVQGRLVVARESSNGASYELAHEALVTGWGTLRGWLDEHAEGHAVKQRIVTSASEWERLGGTREALWSERQLEEARIVDPETLLPREAAFLRASRRAVTRARRVRRGLLIGLPLLIMAVYVGVRFTTARALERRVAERFLAAGQAYQEARQRHELLQRTRQQAFTAYRSMAPEQGERHWAESLSLAAEVDRLYERASLALEAASVLGRGRDRIHAMLGDILLERALTAEAMFDTRLRDEQLRRLEMYDRDGSRMAYWNKPARLSIDSSPAGAAVTIARYQEDDQQRVRLTAPRPLGVTPIQDRQVAQGSYMLTLSAEGRTTVHHPFVARRDETLTLSVHLPRPSEIPDGYIYIPEGGFLFGSSDDEVTRVSFLEAPPLHEVVTDSYLIARHETTFGEWIEYLETLPPEQRGRPYSDPEGDTIRLQEVERGVWQLTLQIVGTLHTARSDETLIYEDRTERREQDWLRFPATGMSYDDALGYTGWLDRTGRVPGARLCTEYEWERAARGADARYFPHGYTLQPGDANYDEAYGKDPRRMGPDEVGGYPLSTSPFGVENMAGNAFEWTTSSLVVDDVLARGGSYFYVGLNSRVNNRTKLDRNIRAEVLGFRVCASYRSEAEE